MHGLRAAGKPVLPKYPQKYNHGFGQGALDDDYQP